MNPKIKSRRLIGRLVACLAIYAPFLGAAHLASAPLRRATVALRPAAPERSHPSILKLADAPASSPVHPASLPAQQVPAAPPVAVRTPPAPGRRRSPRSDPMTVLPDFWPPHRDGLPSPEELARMALIWQEFARLEREHARRVAGAR